MDRIDRSNTNWTPWPRLNFIPQKFQVIGGVSTIMFSAFLMLKWRQSAAGKLPSTINKEWEAATEKLSEGKETESGADPVVMNPITKHLRERKAN